MQVNWIKGSIPPGQDGDFYILAEALRFLWNDDEVYAYPGELVIDRAVWRESLGGFYGAAGSDPLWRVLAWAPIIYPDVPKEDRPRLRGYFGERVRITDGGTWLTGAAAREDDNG